MAKWRNILAGSGGMLGLFVGNDRGIVKSSVVVKIHQMIVVKGFLHYNQYMKEKSAAANKRRPLVLKIKDGTTKPIYCDDHPEGRATFRCLKCGHLFCEACVGGEDGDKTYCINCKGFYEQDEKRRQAQEKKAVAAPSLKKAELTLAALGVGVSLALGYYVYENSKDPVINRGGLSVEETEMVQDANRLVSETDRLVREGIIESERLLATPVESLGDEYE
ncbi:B-box zinc finger [Mariprofundus aestuarium]|uniref:B-box zinc finger n=1 Tax=Mariprofundus aestuarium TaxID=1921086 RepID=A0A2K8KZL2_MARES|nr:B-box zinc finger protein [Mariprofundus aestuarium]ATX79359.1 B-box zinc finger [Mariprofundus aestuarium]